MGCPPTGRFCYSSLFPSTYFLVLLVFKVVRLVVGLTLHFLVGQHGERVFDQEAHQSLRVEDEFVAVRPVVPGMNKMNE
jgi:hypothetical protein